MIKITTFFLNRPKVANLILIFIILAGLLTIRNLENQGYPSVDFGIITITTVYPGASPKDIEIKITTKIEDTLKTVSGIDRLTSYSIENISQIFITLKEGTNFDDSKNDINKAIQQVRNLPGDLPSPPIIFELNNNAIPVMEIGIIGEAPYAEKRQYATALKNKLRLNSLVGDIELVGYRKREVKINVDNTKLNKHYLSLNTIIQAIQSQHFRLSSGDILNPKNEKKLIIESEYKSLEDIKEVIIRSGFEGNRLVLSDIATIKDDFEKPTQFVKIDGQDAIQLIIQKKPASDVVKTTNSIKKQLQEFNKAAPKNITSTLIQDYSIEVRSLLKMVIDNGLLGFALIIFALFYFLNLRVALWTALGIPISICIGFLFFPAFDITINFISLSGIIIVLGMLVDDAVIIAENIFYHKEQGLAPRDAAIKGVKEIAWPVITTVITTIIAFLPMLTMTGVMGRFMKTMPLVIAFILLGSLIESLFILPSHLMHSAPQVTKRKKIRIFATLEAKYFIFIQWIMTHKIKTIATFIAIFISAILLLVVSGKFILFPTEDAILGYIKFETTRGESLTETEQHSKQLETMLNAYPKNELKAFVTTIGERSPRVATNFVKTGSSDGHVGNVVLHFTKKSNRDRSTQEILNEIRQKTKEIPAFSKTFVDIVNDGPPVGKPITVTFISNDDSARNTIAQKLKAYLYTQKGTFNIEDNIGEGKEELSIKLNYKIISQLGVLPISVAQTIKTAFEGTIVTKQEQQGEEVNYRVILDKNQRTSLATLKTLTVENMQGKQIPINQLVTITPKTPLTSIQHFDGDRSITIYGDLDTDIITSTEINKKIKNTFEPLINEYPDMRLVFGGEEKETQDSMTSLFNALFLAIIGIYFILVILFNSFTQPFLVMVVIPYSFVGVIFAFLLHNMPLSFAGMIGMIGLIGVVINNSLVMITFMNNMRDQHGDSIEVYAKGATRRLRPIILTTLTTAAGLFPTAYGFGGDNPILVPMILAIAWGLVFSTFISLILIPALYVAQIEAKGKIKALLSR